MIDVHVDDRLVKAALRTLHGDQVPFALSRAINDTAKDFQQAERQRVKEKFTLRQERFILNTVKINRGDFASKRNLRAIVGIDPQRDQLAKRERGGFKSSVAGKPFVAIPSRDIRRTKRGLVPRSLYPAAFKPFTRATNLRSFGGRQVTNVGQKGTFFVKLSGGRRLLLQRTGKKRTSVRALYLFVRATKLDRRLGFHDTARKTVEAKFSPNFARAFAEAVRTAR